MTSGNRLSKRIYDVIGMKLGRRPVMIAITYGDTAHAGGVRSFNIVHGSIALVNVKTDDRAPHRHGGVRPIAT